MAELGEANIGGRMVPAWLLDTPAKYLDGGLPVIQANDDLDSYITPGEYIQGNTSAIATLVNFPVNLPKGEMCLKVSSLGASGYICQEIKSKGGLRFGRAIRFSNAGVFQPWEYEDPELRLGVEYRTTERYLGKPVYVKAIDCGEITNGKEITTEIYYPIKVDVVALSGYYSLPLPLVSFQTTAADLPDAYSTAFYVNANKIIFICGTSGSGDQGTAIIRYTKTTD